MKMSKKNLFLIIIALVAAIISFFIPISNYKGTEKVITLIIRAIIICISIIVIMSLIFKKTSKYDTFKVLLITILVSMVFSFIIPQSQIGYGGIEKGVINPITFIDSISNGLTSFSVFISTFIYIISIGIFYVILKKTGKYETVINNTAVKFKNNKKLFVIISILTFALLTAVIGEIYAMVVFVPAFIDIAKKLGYDSKSAILSTVGAIIVGSVGSLNTSYANQILSTTVSSNIFVKLIVLVISLIVLILFTIFTSNPKEVKLEKEKVKNGKILPIVFDIMLVLLILGMVPWNTYFGFEGFSNFHSTITEFEVFKVSLFNSIIGSTLAAFGEWAIYTWTVLIVIVSLVLSIIYKFSIDEMLESIAKGIRKAIPYGLILILANIILVGVYNSGFFITVIDSVAKMKDTVLSSTTLSALAALVYPDYAYASQFTLSTLATVISKRAIFPVLAIIFQSIYSLFLLVSPTSILILMALRYEQISYKDWFKFVGKLFLGLLIISFVTIMIIGGKYISPISYIVLVVLIIILILLFMLSRPREDKKEVAKKRKSVKKK